MRLNTSHLLAILVSSLLVLPAVTSAAEAKYAVVVNGVGVPQSRLDFLLKQAQARKEKDTPELRKALKDNLVIGEAIVQEALKKGLDKDAETQTELDMTRQAVLFRAYIKDYLKNNPISDAAIKSEYDKFKVTLGDKEYKVRHILVDKEAEAKEILAQLKKGAKFDKLATERSKDSSKQRGGELDWATTLNFVPAFSDAMAKLSKGQITPEPVRTEYGWHIIKLEDTRTLKAPTLEEMKPTIQERLQQEQINKAIGDIKAKAKVE